MTNAVKYILKKQPSEIMTNIINNAPGICPLYVLTGYGMSKRCKNGNCKKMRYCMAGEEGGNEMIYYNGKWLIEPEIKAELDRLNCEIERLERENAVLRASVEKIENEEE